MSELSQEQMSTELVASPLGYDLLVADGAGDDAPLIVWLHGGNGPDGFAELCRFAFDAVWEEGALAPAKVVFPHSTRSFWLDGVGDRAAWETVLVEDLVPHARTAHRCGPATAIGGMSMGGMGGLRAAFRHSDRFDAVAVLEPAIEPTPIWADVTLRDSFYRVDGAVEALYGDPVDPDRFWFNHPMAIAECHGVEMAANGLAVYFECGDEDALNLHHGAEALHRRMWDLGLVHEYRSVRGANHVGRSLGPRMIDAIRFIGRSLRPSSPDPAVETIVAGTSATHERTGMRRTTTVNGPSGPIEVREYGEGPPVVMIPSLGRGAEDFDDLAARLARAGYHAIAPEPRGIGGSTGELSGLTMEDLAADAAAVIHARATGPVTLVGHAFGNRVARMTATDHPHLIDSVVLLAAGGMVQPAPEHAAALQRVFDPELPDEEHSAAVEQAFFAPGNDPAVWFDGWHGIVAAVQGAATTNQPVEHWWGAGGKPIFVVQPADDVMAVPENGERLVEEFPDRAVMVTVPRSGHALLPEQPEAVAVALRSWLRRDR